MRKFFPYIAAVILTIGATAAQAQTAALTDDEVAVIVRAYSLTRQGGPENTLVLPAETTNFQCTGESGVRLGGCTGGMRTTKIEADDVVGWLSRQFSAVASPELLADFRSKAQYSGRVTGPLPIEMKQVIGEPPKDDESARPYLVLAFSRVGFNADKTQALVYLASMSGSDPKRSYGEYLCLRLDDNAWKIAGRARNWALK